MIIKFENVPRDTPKSDLRAEFKSSCSSIAYFDFNEGDTHGYIRFHNRKDAQCVISDLADMKIPSLKSIKARFLTDTEELEYSDRVTKAKDAFRVRKDQDEIPNSRPTDKGKEKSNKEKSQEFLQPTEPQSKSPDTNHEVRFKRKRKDLELLSSAISAAQTAAVAAQTAAEAATKAVNAVQIALAFIAEQEGEEESSKKRRREEKEPKSNKRQKL